MVNGYLMFGKENISYSYIFRKVGNLLKLIILWNLLIMLPVFIFRHKFINPIILSINCLLQKGYLWHFWFFGALLLLYLIMPPIHTYLKKNKSAHMSICIALAVVCVSVSIISMYKGYELLMLVPQMFRIWLWLFFFLFGGLCADIHAEAGDRLGGLRKKYPLWLHGVFTVALAFVNNIAIKKVGLYLVHNRLADVFYGNLTSLLWYIVLFTFLLRISFRKESTENYIVKFSSLTLGIFILHPIVLMGLNGFWKAVGAGQAVLLWLGLVVGTGLFSYLIGKLPGVRTLVKI